jgi:hypothetical protein
MLLSLEESIGKQMITRWNTIVVIPEPVDCKMYSAEELTTMLDCKDDKIKNLVAGLYRVIAQIGIQVDEYDYQPNTMIIIPYTGSCHDEILIWHINLAQKNLVCDTNGNLLIPRIISDHVCSVKQDLDGILEMNGPCSLCNPSNTSNSMAQSMFGIIRKLASLMELLSEDTLSAENEQQTVDIISEFMDDTAEFKRELIEKLNVIPTDQGKITLLRLITSGILENFT